MEIERKYLVNKELWLKANKPVGEYIIQGYLTTDIDKTIRVRVSGPGGYVTIKGKTVNLSREEYEFSVPVNIATRLIQKFSEGIIEKIRYRVTYKGKTWEVDEFMGDNDWLGILSKHGKTIKLQLNDYDRYSGIFEN